MTLELTIPIIPLICIIVGMVLGLIYKYFNPTVVYERRRGTPKTEADFLHIIKAVKKFKPIIYRRLKLNKEENKEKKETVDALIDGAEELLQDAEIMKLVKEFMR